MSQGGAYLRLTAACAAWAGSTIAVKLSVTALSPIWLAFPRYGIAALLFAVVLLARGSRIKSWPVFWIVIIAGVFGVVFWAWGFNTSMRLTSAGEGTLVSALSPIVTGLLAMLLLGDKLNRWFAVGVCVSLTGTAVLVAGGPGLAPGGADHLLGDFIMLAAALGWGTYNVLVRLLQTRGVDLIETSGFTAIAGAVLLAPLAFADPEQPVFTEVPVGAWIAVLYLAVVSTFGAYLWWNEGVRRIGAPRASVFTNLTTVLSVILAAIILGERLTPLQIVGGGVVLLGLFLSNRGRTLSQTPTASGQRTE